MAMNHEFERHIEFATKGNNQRGVAALNALKIQYEILALAGIVPVLPKEQASISGQLSSLHSNNLPIVARQEESPNALTDALEHISGAVRSGSPHVANADTTDKLVRLLPGLTKENLYYWERKGLIHPEMAKRGKKTWRQYSSSEALQVACIRRRLSEGFSLSSAAAMAKEDVAKIMESQSEAMRSSLGEQSQNKD